MDFSAWNYAKSFRLHEAACLIAGVMPIAKKFPTSEELPPQAIPVLKHLVFAYFEWLRQQHYPALPKVLCLEGCLEIDGTVPTPVLEELSGALVSREALHRFLTEFGDVGHSSGYDFSPINRVVTSVMSTELESGARSEAVVLSEPVVYSKKGTPAALNDGQKSEIVNLYGSGRGLSVNKLALRFSVSRRTIDKALIDAGVKMGARGRTREANTTSKSA